MTRKRFIKLLMSEGYSRNEARDNAEFISCVTRRACMANKIRKISGNEIRVDFSNYSYATYLQKRREFKERMKKAAEAWAADDVPKSHEVKKITHRSGNKKRFRYTDTVVIAARACVLNVPGVDYDAETVD